MVYKYWPLTFAVDRLPEGISQFDGYSFGFFILVKSNLSTEQKASIIEHERVHCRQFFRTAFLHPILYRLSKRYRLRSEVEAYANQIKLLSEAEIPEACFEVADNLRKHYGLECFSYNHVSEILLGKFNIPFVYRQ